MKRFFLSIWEGIKTFEIMPDQSGVEPFSYHAPSYEESMKKDAEALQGDWQRAIDSLNIEIKEKHYDK